MANKLDDIVAGARQQREERENGYRQRALKMYPWVCGRCCREFDRHNVQELTVHHRDHNHDNNPADGSNWELLCRYCHDNEHARLFDGAGTRNTDGQQTTATHNPFADLAKMLKKED